MSAQKGFGDRPGQLSHLPAESDPRGDRSHPKVTGQVHSRAGAKTHQPCPVPALSFDRNPLLEQDTGKSPHVCHPGAWLAWDLLPTSLKASGPHASGCAHQKCSAQGQSGIP